MNTTELKKMAEATNLTIHQRASTTLDEFFEAEQLRSRYRKESPDAILKLLAINVELVEALKGLDEAYCRAGPQLTRDERNIDRKRLIIARAALAKAEGGEL